MSETTSLIAEAQPDQQNDGGYDIFISYRFTQQDWAVALAHNLVAQGFKVFIDTWELYGGQNFTQVIEQALRQSRCAVLIATPEAAESGWVQREYDLMFNLTQRLDEFFFVPVVWGEFPDFPFLDTMQAVDFKQSNEAQYREGFQRLLCALRQQAPGAAPYFRGKLTLPESAALATETIVTPKQQSFVERVFEDFLEADLPLMILAQDGFNTPHYTQAIKQGAEQRYGATQVLHIYPPAGLQAGDGKYFAQLGQQCGFNAEINDSYSWCQQMAQRLDGADTLFLLVSGFENGAESARRDLAGELRNLIETYSFNFKLVLLGGERLAAMKYEDDDLSFLNRLEEVPLPSLCEEDLRLLYLPRYRGLDLDETALAELLAFSGRHPRVVEGCLRALRQGAGDYQQLVQDSVVAAQLFARFNREDELAGLCGCLAQGDLGRYSTWPRDEWVRRLYWQNLLCDEQGRMVWRSGWIRDVGKELFECG